MAAYPDARLGGRFRILRPNLGHAWSADRWPGRPVAAHEERLNGWAGLVMNAGYAVGHGISLLHTRYEPVHIPFY